MKLSTLSQFSSNAHRFREIVTVLARYGLASWLDENDPEFLKLLLKDSKGVALSELSHEKRLRMALTELGTTFIKLGQILSTRTDLISQSLATELTRLQADVPADDEDTVRKTIEEELGKSLEDLFAQFDFVPLGSASIGQAHKARLHSGETVVVKVQHAGIEPRIENDLEILKAMAQLAERYDDDLKLYQPTTIVDEFSRSIMRELDFRRELRNSKQFKLNFANNKWIHIPEVYPELSSKRVLTMEMVKGFSIADLEKVEAADINKQDFVLRGANMYLDMVFRDRFFHGDPHPGNIWVLDDGRLGLLDSGMTGRIDTEMREELEGMLLAAVDNNPGQFTYHVMHVATSPEPLDRNVLRRDIDDFLSEYINVSVEDLDLSTTLNNLTDIIRKHHLLLPSGISSLIRVLIMLEGTSRLLDRNFSLAELIQPFAIRSIQRRFSPNKLLEQARYAHRDWDRLVKILPRELFDILIKVREGDFSISIEHHDLEGVVKWLVQGILSAALIMGGSIVMSQSIPPLLFGMSAIGIATFGSGLILGYKLLNSMNK